MVSYRDWVVETSSTTGTGTYSLSGSPPAGTSYFTFRQRYSNGDDEVCYWVVSGDRTKWEKNRFGTLTYGTPDTLSRNVVESTSGDAPISWVGGDGPLRIYVVPDADAEEFSISMGLGTSRPEVLKFGVWADENDVATGIHTLKFFDGTDDISIGSVNLAANKYIPAPTAINFSPGHIAGTYANAAGDVTNDIDISAGSAMDGTNVYPMIWSAMTKRLDAAWAVGSGNGGLDTGAIANADYFIWIIVRPDTGVVDALFSLSATAPTMPTNYTLKRLFGWIRRSGAAIQLFHTYETEGGGLDLQWDVPAIEVNLSNTLTTARRLDVVRVPLGLRVLSHLTALCSDAGGGAQVRICDPNEVDAAVSSAAAPFPNLYSATGDLGARQLFVRTNTSGQVASRASLTVDTYLVSTTGFTWGRR